MTTLLDWCSILSILPPGGMVLYCLKRLNVPYGILGFFILFTLVMETLGTILFIYGINNQLFFHLFTWVEGITLSLFYFCLSERKAFKLLFAVWGVVFLSFSLYFFLHDGKTDHFNTLQRSFGSIWGALLALFFFLNIFQESVVKDLFRYPPFLMTSAFLLYFAGTLFHHLFADYVMTHKIYTFNTFDIHSVLNVFLNIIYTIVIWMGSRKLI